MKINSLSNSNYKTNKSCSFGIVNLKKTPKLPKFPQKSKDEKDFTLKIYLPDRVGNVAKWISQYVGLPEQKLFLAATAFLFQPAIDMKFAEEDKKSDVAIKSAAKALAGGITGVAIRGLSEQFFKNRIGITKTGKRKANWVNDIFFPMKCFEDLKIEGFIEYDRNIKKYCTTLGNICALITMIGVTNEKIDVPLTSDFQDLFTNVARDNKTWENSLDTVITSRKNKIKRGINDKINFFKRLKDKIRRIKDIIEEDDIKTNGKNKNGMLNRGALNA